MKRKLFALVVVVTLILFFANGFAKKDGTKLKNPEYEGNGYLRYWNYDTPPCDERVDVENPGCAIENDDSIRIYEFNLNILIHKKRVFGYIEISKGPTKWCRQWGEMEYWGKFRIKNGIIVGNTVIFSVVAVPANPDPGEYSLRTFHLAENDLNGEFNGNSNLIGGAVHPGNNDLGELIYVELDLVE